MNRVSFIKGQLVEGKIKTELEPQAIAEYIAQKNIIIVKGLFPTSLIEQVKQSVFDWSQQTPAANADDFTTNYHCLRAKVSNIQQSPHVFHDYNFNDMPTLDSTLQQRLLAVFEPLRVFYNELTHNNATMGYQAGIPVIHPQLIQYPLGGGFFGRHNHNLLPQQIGFILGLSKYGQDYSGGGTCFVIEDEIIDLEGQQDIGDLCLWPNDIDHWVKQSPLNDPFSWQSPKGRWVITLAYFNPFPQNN